MLYNTLCTALTITYAVMLCAVRNNIINFISIWVPILVEVAHYDKTQIFLRAMEIQMLIDNVHMSWNKHIIMYVLQAHQDM